MARQPLHNPSADNSRAVTKDRHRAKARKPAQLTDEQYRRIGGVADDFNVRGLAAQMNGIGGHINGTRPDWAISRLTNKKGQR